MPRYTTGQLYALVALTGGDVSRAAEIIGIDEEVLQAAYDGQQLPRNLQKTLERNIEDLEDENEELYSKIITAGRAIDIAPIARSVVEKQITETVERKTETGRRRSERIVERELRQLVDNAERMQTVLEFYPQLTEILENDGVGEALLKRQEFVNIFFRDPTKWQDDSGKWYSHGGLYPGAIDVIIDWAKNTKKGTPRKRGQADLSPMIEALEEDDYEIGYIDESAFWRWFRSIYPGS